jgi:nucleoside phosphorylase
VTVHQKATEPRRAVILTALRVEYQAVRTHLTSIKEETDTNGTIYEIGDFVGHDGLAWKVCVVEIGAGNPNAAARTERAINYFTPRVVMFVGVAGAVKDVSIGDVVAATKVYGYESGKQKRDFEARPDAFSSTYDMRERARAESRREDWISRIQGRKRKSKAWIAPIVSGEKVIASRRAALYRCIRSHFGDAVAVEMEGLGFLNAAEANRQISSLVVRGISDLLDRKAKADATGSQNRAARHASAFAFQVLSKLNLKLLEVDGTAPPTPKNSAQFNRDSIIEALIKNVQFGDLKSGAEPAIELLRHTDAEGRNDLFEKLLDYLNCSDVDLLWKALGTLESCSEVAPWLFTRPVLTRMADHPNFSVRSSAAFICLNFAQYAAEIVPTDILVKLSVHDEDWYVEAPANAALKSMAREVPGVLQIFFTRLHSSNSSERAHAAAALADIADKEPELLDVAQLRDELSRLSDRGDVDASRYLKRAVGKVDRSKRREGYRYSI